MRQIVSYKALDEFVVCLCLPIVVFLLHSCRNLYYALVVIYYTPVLFLLHSCRNLLHSCRNLYYAPVLLYGNRHKVPNQLAHKGTHFFSFPQPHPPLSPPPHILLPISAPPTPHLHNQNADDQLSARPTTFQIMPISQPPTPHLHTTYSSSPPHLFPTYSPSPHHQSPTDSQPILHLITPLSRLLNYFYHTNFARIMQSPFVRMQKISYLCRGYEELLPNYYQSITEA